MMIHLRTSALTALLASALLTSSNHGVACHDPACAAAHGGALAIPATGCCSHGQIADLATLTAAADRIVRGRITRVESAWHPTRKLILTHATIAVEATLKGEPAATLVVSSMGGVVGDVAMTASGERPLPIGAHVALFLENVADLGILRTCHSGQGVMSVAVDQGREVVVPAIAQCMAAIADHDHGAVSAEVFSVAVSRLVAAHTAPRGEVRR